MPPFTLRCPDGHHPVSPRLLAAPAHADEAALIALGQAAGDGRRLVLAGAPAVTRATLGRWLDALAPETRLIIAPAERAFQHQGPAAMLHGLCEAIRRLLATPEPVPVTRAGLGEALPGWLARLGASKAAVVVIEAVDALAGEDPARWLPAYLPPAVTCAVTVSDAASAERLAAQGWTSCTVARTAPDSAASAGELLAAEPELAVMLAAYPDGLDETTAAGVDSEGTQRTAGGDHLRPEESRLLAQDPALPAAIAAAAGTDWPQHLIRLANASGDVLRAGGWLARAEAWHALAERLRNPVSLDAWHDDPAALVELWQRLPAPDTAVAGLLADLRRQRRETPSPEALRRQLAAVDLLTALGEEAEADGLLEELIPWASARGAPQAVRAEALHRAGNRALDGGDTERAVEWLERAVALRRGDTVPADLAGVRASRHALTAALESAGRLEEAEHAYHEALAQAMEEHGEASPALLPHLTNLAGVQRACNRLQPARDNLERALQLAERQLGRDHPAAAGALDNLAGVLYAGGDREGAEKRYREAADVTERLFGPDHPATAAAQHNLGTCLDTLGHYREAEACFRRALAMRRGAHGDYHTDTASTLHNLAGVLEVTGRRGDAVSLYREAVVVWEMLVGQEHPATATSVNNLADLLKEVGEHAEAEDLYERNVKTWSALYGDGHPNVQMTRAELGGLYAESGRDAEAEPLLQRALEGLAETVGRTSGLYLDALTQLATVWRRKGKRREALELIDAALAAAEGSTAVLSARFQKLRRHRELLEQGNGHG